MLLHVSVAEYPLRVRKIESGSLWVEIAGEATTVGILASLLLRGARYLHRGFTVEGKRERIPKQVDAAEHVFRLRDQLRRAGIRIWQREAR